MNELVFKVGIATVIGLCCFGGGKAYADHSNEDARRKQNEENERLRKILKSILETFAAENEKMQEAIANIWKSPPADINKLIALLGSLALSDVQIFKIISRVRGAGLYRVVS